LGNKGSEPNQENDNDRPQIEIQNKVIDLKDCSAKERLKSILANLRMENRFDLDSIWKIENQ